MTFARLAVAWAERRFENAPLEEGAMRSVSGQVRSVTLPLPSSPSTYNFATSRGTYVVLKIDAPRVRAEVSDTIFAILSHYDGETSSDEVEAMARRLRAAAPTAVRDVRALVNYLRIAAPPFGAVAEPVLAIDF